MKKQNEFYDAIGTCTSSGLHDSLQLIHSLKTGSSFP